MKITKAELRRIIEEELKKTNSINESWTDDDYEDDPAEVESSELQDKLYEMMRGAISQHLTRQYNNLRKIASQEVFNMTNEEGWLDGDDVEHFIVDMLEELEETQPKALVSALQRDTDVEILINDTAMAYARAGRVYDDGPDPETEELDEESSSESVMRET